MKAFKILKKHRTYTWHIDKKQNIYITAGNLHTQNIWFCNENRERIFRLCLSGVIVTASKGMYISKSQFSYSTDQNIENRRMLCCGEYFNEEIHVSFTVVRRVELLQNQLPHEKLLKKVTFQFWNGSIYRPTSSNLVFFFGQWVWMLFLAACVLSCVDRRLNNSKNYIF